MSSTATSSTPHAEAGAAAIEGSGPVPAAAATLTAAAITAATRQYIRTLKRLSYCTTKDVRSVPADPQETTIAQRPGVVRDPTFHVQLTRPPTGRFG